MTGLNTNSLLLAIFAILGILMSNNNSNMVAGCIEDLQALKIYCGIFLEKNMARSNPSPACCSVFLTLDVPCTCEHITKEIEQVIDMGKFVYAAKYCGMPLLPGIQCGSFSVPPA
ncbi:hypothetical protein I3843_13G008600 [Carya illinoinensis]|uniref:Bifunctional inhibitor/plant lipid transfer protein/seed storage helical domain-containing protein n=1 Tax=Carya illinoinensis TaxID=32201 RepID=A0A922AEG1_CARIL|nr:uncharacterized protein LOC122291518 [Carya illinoinensis]KAG6679804.1 hypothetical protein I3842_13G009700 [Carya illinoinensis]KAG7948423.1 hypothetical protein I3843_13G008600 [Carya illinoinensis]